MYTYLYRVIFGPFNEVLPGDQMQQKLLLRSDSAHGQVLLHVHDVDPKRVHLVHLLNDGEQLLVGGADVDHGLTPHQEQVLFAGLAHLLINFNNLVCLVTVDILHKNNKIISRV